MTLKFEDDVVVGRVLDIELEVVNWLMLRVRWKDGR